MSPALLRRVGEALFGPRWQSELARALGISDRSMRYWARDGAPGSVVPEIRALMETRRDEVADILAELDAAAGGGDDGGTGGH